MKRLIIGIMMGGFLLGSGIVACTVDQGYPVYNGQRGNTYGLPASSCRFDYNWFQSCGCYYEIYNYYPYERLVCLRD